MVRPATIGPVLLAIALMACVPADTASASYVAQNGERVQGTAAGFTVLASPGQGASRSWCAAGDFVIRRLGLSRNTRVWRMDEPPRRQGQGVRFSLSGEGAATSSGLARFPDSGSMSANAAQNLCIRGNENRRR
jgi:hypothetical protein